MSQADPISRQPIRFGVFELDPQTGELRRNGTRVKLQEQPLQILQTLLNNPGRLVSREDLRKRIWPADTFVDFDRGLYSALARLRDALGDSAENPRFIETIPRRGYCFIAPVEVSSNAETYRVRDVTSAVEADASGQTQLVARNNRRRWYLVLTSVVIVAGFLAVLGFPILRSGHRSAPTALRIRSLAVLPIENLSGDLTQDFLADGMTEELITELGKSSAVRVISRTSVMQYKGTKKPVQQIARELNVDAVLEGTVLRSGNHLRITANLVQSSPETHLWAETYDGDDGDILSVQQRVADSVAREIRVTLSPRDSTMSRDGRSVNPEAQDLYFRGLSALRSAGGGSTQTAVDYLQRAVKKDSNFARAYAVLAMVYAVWYPDDPGPHENMPKAREAALKAEALDNSLASAHMALAYIDLNYDWNFAEAERESKRALELDPNLAIARNFYARELVVLGRTDEALLQVRRALEIEPYSSMDYPAWIFYLARRYNDSLELAQKMVAINPNFSWGRWALAVNYEQLGKPKEAAEEYLKFEVLSGSSPERIKRLEAGLARSGARGFWQASLAEYLKTAKSSYAPPVLVAGACMRLGDRACALQWLEKGYHERDDLMIQLNVDPVFDGLHSEPQFQDLVRRVGLPEGKPQT
jgi:TolB-like protein/DNA-binding winged helix-turn-helix (wHTH) protein/tetratricopeptide (TPR) repeat protein